jgi:hypothetical protein
MKEDYKTYLCVTWEVRKLAPTNKYRGCVKTLNLYPTNLTRE